ncbi:glyoxylate/hydroxypyruvate reductase A-like isoform X2 [Periplaneta americana]|uniref:glyoxylate/hydroxypyruvate reductase A-like isoform X2 n=1 Tax=Periplaneta americana TaxID=6978 RepID=UPI0037E74D8B
MREVLRMYHVFKFYALTKQWSEDEEMKLLREAEIIIADNDLLGTQLYNLPAAKWVQGTWAGVEKIMQHYDVTKLKPSFTITRFSNYFFGTLMGEYVIANIVNHERNLMTVYRNQQACVWSKEGNISDYRSISDLAVGILGVGMIGTDIAKTLKTFRARVWGMVRTMPNENKKSPHIDEYRSSSDLPELLRNCDYIISVLPSTPDTIGLLNGEMLKHCAQKRAVLINIGRGSVVREEDLVNALNNGWLSAAILDVFEMEPLPASNALWTMPQVKITPHVSGMTRPQDVALFFKDNLFKYRANKPLDGILDFEKGY